RCRWDKVKHTSQFGNGKSVGGPVRRAAAAVGWPEPFARSPRVPAKPTIKPEFVPVFNALRTILAKHSAKLKVVHDRPDNYYLDTYTIGANRHPIFFGGVRIGKGYVSYYL